MENFKTRLQSNHAGDYTVNFQVSNWRVYTVMLLVGLPPDVTVDLNDQVERIRPVLH